MKNQSIPDCERPGNVAVVSAYSQCVIPPRTANDPDLGIFSRVALSGATVGAHKLLGTLYLIQKTTYEICEGTPRLQPHRAGDIPHDFQTGIVLTHFLVYLPTLRSPRMRKIWTQVCNPYRSMAPPCTRVCQAFGVRSPFARTYARRIVFVFRGFRVK